MEFDKSKVYTALNADELKIGSKVIVADDIASLRDRVKEDKDIVTLEMVRPEWFESRFEDDTCYWTLAYLVSEPGENKLHWDDLQIGDIVRCKFKNVKHMITGINEEDKCVFFGGEWTRDRELADWEKVQEETSE